MAEEKGRAFHFIDIPEKESVDECLYRRACARLFAETHPSDFGEESVTEWLLGSNRKTQAEYSRTTIETSGPGEVQGWKLLGGESACFATNEWQAAKPKKKVILSLAYLNFLAMRPNELQLFSALIEYYEVYLWQGKEINIATAKPLSSIHDYLRLCATMPPASAATIQDYLEKNHLAVDDYIIIDLQSYFERWDIPLYLTAEGCNSREKLQSFLDSLDPLISTLRLSGQFPREILAKLQAHFSRIDSLILGNFSNTQLEAAFLFCKKLRVKTLTLQNPLIEATDLDDTFNLSLPENYGLQCLIIIADREINASCDEELELVVFSGRDYFTSRKFKPGKFSPSLPKFSKDLTILTKIKIESLADYQALCASGRNKILTGVDINVPVEIFSKFNLQKDFPRLKCLKLRLTSLEHRKSVFADVELATLPSLEYLFIFPSFIKVRCRTQPKLLQYIGRELLVEPSLFPELRFVDYLNSDKQIIARNLPGLAETKREKKRAAGVLVEPVSTIMDPPDTGLPDVRPSVSSNTQMPQISRYIEEKQTFWDFSFYSLEDELFPHQPTSKPLLIDLRESSTPGRIRYSLRKGGADAEPVHPSNYLGQTYNRIRWDSANDQLYFAKTQPVAGYKDISSSIQSLDKKSDAIAPGLHSGNAKGILQPGVFYPLLLSAPSQDLTLYTSAANPRLELHQDSPNGNYYVRLPADHPPIQVSLYYEFTPQENYNTKPDYEWGLAENPLSSVLRQKISVALQKIPALNFLLDPMLTLREKINQLITFFKGFANDTNLAGQYPPKSLTLLVASIIARCGDCLELSQGFLLLVQWLGIDAQLRANSQHAFIQLRNQDGDLIHLCLGGGIKTNYIFPDSSPSLSRQVSGVSASAVVPSLSAASAASAPVASSASSAASVVAAVAAPVAATPTPTPTPAPAAAVSAPVVAASAPAKISYEELIRKQLDKPEVFSWDALAADTKSSKPRLIRLSEDQSMTELLAAYFSPKDIPGEHLFINQASDFKNYAQKFAIKEGRCIQVTSPLENILASGGFLFINLSNLSEEQQENYQSLWADPPHWNCKPIHKNTRIIGFLAENLSCSPSFAHRAIATRLPPQSQSSRRSIISPEPQGTSPTIAVDLFKDNDWYEQLVADITFKGRGRADSTDGPLLRAIRLKQPLIIHQPPDDPEFKELLKQIRRFGRFYFNGAWQIVPPEVHISIAAGPLVAPPITPPFKILSDDKVASGAERHYLHLNNWHSLYKQVIADEKTSHPITVDGLLMAKQPPVFYVTENIPPWKWQRLALFLEKQHPKREYTFQLAPNVSAEINYFPQRKIVPAKPKTVDVTELSKAVEGGQSCSFFSNDSSYLAKKIQDLCPASEAAFIIDLTPESAVTNLLYNVSAEYPEGSDAQFSIRKFALLEALEQGKTVILRGEIPKSLRMALQPLFGPKPYVEYNGERLPITGRLILVQPSQAAETALDGCPHMGCEFTLEDYRRELLAAKKPDQKDRLLPKEQTREEEIVDKLLLLFKLAPWPHRGGTMPESLNLSFTSLRNMRQKLLERPASGHRHNPIKGLLLGDYLPDSEEYAFLNVLCKLLFDESEQDPMRVEKYQRLCERIPETGGSEYVWRALNTCNGATLKTLLDENWLEEMAKNPLSPEGLIACWKSDWPRIFKALDAQQQHEQSLSRQASASPATLSTGKPKPQELKTAAVEQIFSRQLKTKRRLADLLGSKTSPRVIVLKGEPGVGKSHFLNDLAKDEQFDCLQDFESGGTTTSAPDKPQFYLKDEANTAQPGMLNPWDAAHRDSATLVHRGQCYATPSKFFATANHESYAGRFYQKVLRDAETEWLKMSNVLELERWLVDYYKISPTQASQLMAAAELYKTYQPFKGYSYRELHSLMQQLYVLEKRQFTCDPEKLLRSRYGDDFVLKLSPAKRQELLKEIVAEQVAEKSCAAACEEFAAAIPEVAEQQRFIAQLRSHLKLSPLAPAAKNKAIQAGDKVFPAEMQAAYRGLRQALGIRDHVLAKHREAKDASSNYYKRGLLLQGAIGIGKTELIRTALRNDGFTAASPASADPRHHYLEVNAREENFEEIATLAFHKRMILVVEDLHRLPRKKERFYGDLLMGIVQGKIDEVPGFMILSDGNYGGSLSPALCSRMNIHHVAPLSDASWELLAQQRLVSKSQAHAFAQGFWHPKTPYPRKLTGHDFFGYLDKISAKPGI